LFFYWCSYLAAAGGDILVGTGSRTFAKGKRRSQMKASTKDQIKGKLHELRGNLKAKAGQVTNNPSLAAEGQNERLAGKVQKKIGQVEEVFEK
jgi:uncharacterized protein YjbJ (UPF0337 family)